MTLPSNLLSATQAHIDQLVAEQASEGPHLDFKRELPSTWNDAAKHEFLADVTAFANAGGGDLIYGLNEDGQAKAAEVIPQVLANADQEVRRIQDFLLNLAEPRLPGVQVRAISVKAGTTNGHVIIVRVPQSWVGPHRVKTNQHFFVRDGLRKRQLDVPEIRALFLRSDHQAQRVRDFRTERLGKLFSGEAPHPLIDAPLLVVHLIPTQAALGLVQIDPVPYTDRQSLPLLGATPTLARLNIDGALVVRNVNPHGATHGYSQLFRNGFFEATFSLSHRTDQGLALLPSTSYEEYVVRLLGSFRGELTRLGISCECSVMLSLLHANRVKLGVSNMFDFFESHQTLFDRPTIILPDVLAPSETAPEQALRPAFDMLWQAAGFSQSRNYNSAGEWAPRN